VHAEAFAAGRGDPARAVAGVATYTITSNADNGRFVTVGAVVRLDRRFADMAEQHRLRSWTASAAYQAPAQSRT